MNKQTIEQMQEVLKKKYTGMTHRQFCEMLGIIPSDEFWDVFYDLVNGFLELDPEYLAKIFSDDSLVDENKSYMRKWRKYIDIRKIKHRYKSTKK